MNTLGNAVDPNAAANGGANHGENELFEENMDIDHYDLNLYIDIYEVGPELYNPMNIGQVEVTANIVTKPDSNFAGNPPSNRRRQQPPDNNGLRLPAFGNNDRMISNLTLVYDRDPNTIVNEATSNRDINSRLGPIRNKGIVKPITLFSDNEQQQTARFPSLIDYGRTSFIHDSYATLMEMAKKYPVKNIDEVEKPEFSVPSKNPGKMPTYLNAVASTNIKLRRCDSYRNAGRIPCRRPQEKIQKKKHRGLQVLASSFNRPICADLTVSSVLDRNRPNRQTPPVLMRWKHRLR